MSDWRDPSDGRGIARIVRRARRIAVLGIKTEAQRDQAAFYVPEYMLRAGYDIVPVPVYYPGRDRDPRAAGLPRRCSDVPGPIDMVNVFRRPHDIPPHLPDILKAQPRGGVVPARDRERCRPPRPWRAPASGGPGPLPAGGAPPPPLNRPARRSAGLPAAAGSVVGAPSRHPRRARSAALQRREAPLELAHLVGREHGRAEARALVVGGDPSERLRAHAAPRRAPAPRTAAPSPPARERGRGGPRARRARS